MTLEIQLPESLRDFVEAQVTAGGHENVSAYVGELVAREARRRAALHRLEELIHEGLESGEPVEVTPEWWARKRAELAAYLPDAAEAEQSGSALTSVR